MFALLASPAFADEKTELKEAERRIEELSKRLKDEMAKSRADSRALSDELNRVKDDLVNKDRQLDQVRRDYDGRLEEEQRTIQRMTRENKLKEKRMQLQLQRATDLLRENGIEVPGEKGAEPKAPQPTLKEVLGTRQITLNLREGTTLTAGIALLSDTTGITIRMSNEVNPELKVGRLNLENVPLQGAIEALIEAAKGQELTWLVKDEALEIAPKRPSK